MIINVDFIESDQNFDVSFNEVQQGATPSETYDGTYEVIPSQYEQKLNTSNKLLENDIVVRAIPKEYGLITYNQDRTIIIT